ncbi:MAG: hypothetical protein QW607_03010 [Desulfurococcaceae archaeon]
MGDCCTKIFVAIKTYSGVDEMVFLRRDRLCTDAGCINYRYFLVDVWNNCYNLYTWLYVEPSEDE